MIGPGKPLQGQKWGDFLSKMLRIQYYKNAASHLFAVIYEQFYTFELSYRFANLYYL
jgi:hypothetical protein